MLLDDINSALEEEMKVSSSYICDDSSKVNKKEALGCYHRPQKQQLIIHKGDTKNKNCHFSVNFAPITTGEDAAMIARLF